MHMSLIKNFQKYGNNLTELEIECFNKLLTFRDLEPSLTISSLAETLNVSTTTIFRMVKKLDYKTFMDFRYDLLYYRRDEYEYQSQLRVHVIPWKKKLKIRLRCYAI